MRLDNFDLNLLVAFDILLQEKNVTKAAARAHVTQAAMSAQLKRLREAFQDEILAQQELEDFEQADEYFGYFGDDEDW